MKTKTFVIEPEYCMDCSQCDFCAQHIHSANEAERWGNKYIYYCNKGFIFIATENKSSNQTLITGPIVMEECDIHDHGLAVYSTKAVGSISEIIFDAYSFYAETEDKITQSELLNVMYELPADLANVKIHLEYENELESAIMLGDKSEVRAIINKLLGFILLIDHDDFNTTKSHVIEFIVLLSRSIIKTGANSNEIFKLNLKYIKEIEGFSNIDKLSAWLIDVVHNFLGYMFDLKDVKNKDVVYKMKSYIEHNYTDKLTLTDVANHIFLSNSYVSKLMKQELDCNFTEYVNKLRIEKSKELLRDANLSLVEIASMVGFDDQSYFTKVFKKRTGLSPGKYRENRLYL